MTRKALTCDNCGIEGRRYRRGLCGPCALAEDLDTVLDDGSGQVRPELLPFRDGMAAMRSPRAGVSWLARPHVEQMLRTLAMPERPLTHETLDGMTPWRSVAYLRDLLMQHGVLPRVDRHLVLFGRWLGERLNEIDQPEQRKLVERFASWHVQRRLRAFADRGPVTEQQTQQAREEIRQALGFLAWLHQRDRRLATCRQADIDAWYAQGYIAHRLTQAFLRWAMSNKLLVKVTIPHRSTVNPAPLDQHHHLAVIRALLTEETIPLLTRVAALLMLLYAQPLTRILKLTLDDVLDADGELSIRLGDPPIPVPEPFAGLLRQHLQQRLNLTTATNRDARWLFPGRRAGQPMVTSTIEIRLRKHGIFALNGRTAALRQLVLQAPAPVVATMLGYSHDHTARTATTAGTTWSRYAPGDHTRLQDRRTDDS
ncbi:hypothetical protein ACQPXB_08065 [Amycolatopsis sp. CA-161197]|uniref:hypothetical protein n=1 Tax=Amycolatopsis sp. CA-161197 TaxID=3239922 RepID=UPI003D8EF62B